MTSPTPVTDATPSRTDASAIPEADPTTVTDADERDGAEDQDDARQAQADDAADDAKIGREAARYRQRLRATEAELAEARDSHAAELTVTRAALAMAHSSVIDGIAEREGVDPALLDALNKPTGWYLTEDGGIDRDAIRTACAEARSRFNVFRRPKPVPQQGAVSGSAGGTPTFGGLLKDAARGSRSR